eukprot:44289_1
MSHTLLKTNKKRKFDSDEYLEINNNEANSNKNIERKRMKLDSTATCDKDCLKSQIPQFSEEDSVQESDSDSDAESDEDSDQDSVEDSDEYSEEEEDFIDCHDIKECPHLVRFAEMMNKYQTKNESYKTYIESALNHYIHLMYEHNSDDEFEFIVHCIRSIRNTNRRNSLKIVNDMNIVDTAYLEIMDKMHCYFYHCYDVGFRLNEQDKMFLNKKNEDCKSENMQTLSLFNINKYNRIKLLSSKQQNTYMQFLQKQNKTPSKFNQMDFVINDNVYSYGYFFSYDEHHRNKWMETIKGRRVIYVDSKYSSLKTEVTQNNVSVLLIDQFAKEYEKASIHFESRYRKINYPNIELEFLLTLMIYCNYTQFQYEFTKTYRVDNGKNHNNFHTMGSNLQFILDEFGTNTKNSNIKYFYHGIGSKLIFPYNSKGINICCPLSTSSSISVAANFT